ncbi:cytochrome b [Roseococcus sp. YIM B11640]|uniref:cytochrome b n=1 Tax=Roseococcus sp. YIM B11640 TaxID=3133973 RepID=UPI003C7D418E
MGYGTTAKWFHWITVVLMAVALPTGFVIQHIAEDHKMAFYAIHESAGLTILIVAALRLWWKVKHPVPLDPGLPPMLRVAANSVHHLLYVALILQPLLGFFTTNAFGFPLRDDTAYLGFINLPKFMEANEGLANALLAGHVWLGWTILLLLCAHIGGVIFHQAIRKDDTLLRMV